MLAFNLWYLRRRPPLVVCGGRTRIPVARVMFHQCSTHTPLHRVQSGSAFTASSQRSDSTWTVEGTAVQSDVFSRIIFETEILKAVWLQTENHWVIQTNTGNYTAKFVVFATGPLHVPSFPAIRGLKDFPGQVFHSAQWNHNVDLKNKRVAVVGSGASAIQFVPENQPDCQHLTLFQRTAPRGCSPNKIFRSPPRGKACSSVFPFCNASFVSSCRWSLSC